MHDEFDRVRAVAWEAGRLLLLDQRALPQQLRRLSIGRADEAAAAIRDMVVRGAPAIGITAAYAAVLAAREARRSAASGWRSPMEAALERLAAARPTAVNLGWALARVRQCLAGLGGDDPESALLALAQRIHAEDLAGNRRMGSLGAALLQEPCGVLTHCNTGSLATGGYGTALGVVRSGYRSGRIHSVFADETRPWLQGSRLTAWELTQDGIPVTLLADGAAPWLMRSGRVSWVITGADRIAANGDCANKIGTYALAIAARHHGLRFMVVAPTSTVDLRVARGEDIPIEERGSEELLSLAGVPVAATGAQAWNPAFDVTPAALVDAIVTEQGVASPVTAQSLARIAQRPG
jgi:methylthioribose-1-phosphate isomerase